MPELNLTNTDPLDLLSIVDEKDPLGLIETSEEKSASWLKQIGKGTLGLSLRTAGIGLGIVNAPLAAVWGSQEAATKYKGPQWKRELVGLKGGLKSAWRSISEKGDWGTLYGDYYKTVKGQSIEKDLPDNLKWAATPLEVLANIVSDPLIVFGEAAKIAQLRVPKGFIGEMPKGMVESLNKLEKLETAEKGILQGKLVDALRNRRDYMRWWDEKGIPEIMKRETERELRRLPELLKVEPEVVVRKPWQAVHPRVPKEGIFRKTKKGLEKIYPAEKVKLPRAIEIKPKAPWWERKMEEAKIRIGGKPEIREIAPVKIQPPSKTITLKATGGLVAGIEQDEQGNVSYNIGKGTAGALLFAGGIKAVNLKKAKKFTQTLAKNPAWTKVHGMIGKEKRSFEISGLLSKVNVKLFDRFGALKRKSLKAYEASRTFSAYKDQAQIKFHELRDTFKKVKDQDALMSDYIDAHRAETRAARGLKNPNDVTLKDAQAAIKEIENYYAAQGKNVKDLREARDALKKWTHDYILKEALDSGMISQSGYGDIVKNNKWYATFDVLERLPENIHDIPSLPSKEFFSVANQNIIKKMVGTRKLIADPIEATIRKFAQAQGTFARNKVASILVDDPAMKPFLRPVAMSESEFRTMQGQKLNPIMSGAWSKREFSTINRFKDGKVERYIVPIEIAESMKQLTTWQAPKIIKALNDIFRKSATSLYLPFTISNAMRDAFMAYTTAPVYKTTAIGKFGKDWIKGFWEGARHEFLGSSDLAKTYIKSGGGFGYVGNLRQGRLAKQALFKKGLVKTSGDIITSPFKLIEKISATIELAPRLGIFQRAKMMEIANADAALIARQSTIDFNRGGTWTKVINQFVPFLNARVQGRVTLASALKRDPKGTAAKVFLSAAIPGMTAYAWNRVYHSDLYDDIPEYVKQNYFCVITGTEIDERTGKTVPKYFVISKGDVGQIAWNPIEFGLDKMWKKDQETTAGFLVNYLSDLSPVEFARKGKISVSKTAGGLLPPIVKGFAEDWANLNLYTGYEIVPYYMGKTKPPELQYRDWTPETYKKLGKLLKISPERIKNFAGNVFAGYGREGLSPTSMLRGLTGRIVRTQAGEIQNQAWITIKDIEQGYIYTRAYAQELIKSGNRSGAIKLMNKWNTGLFNQISEYNDRFKKYRFEDKGGLRQSYLFTVAKRKNLLAGKEERAGMALERKLTIRRKRPITLRRAQQTIK
ncbi:MAG: hypothetical protein E3J56_11070 [Candidatus Aminicenantes bacterium]|nr:MAG: hypothetical protein E3J56_11070 [Candidatus Aminicenantes bacterium]